MKKRASAWIVFLFVILLPVGVCHAGDVPETLLHDDQAQLYFGKVVTLTDDSITVLPVKVIKGDVELDREIVYTQGHMLEYGDPQVGKTYLIGYIDVHNLYYWVTDGTDPKTLKIKNATGMDKRLQDYLNDGDFEQAEEARRAKLHSAAPPASQPASASATAPPPSQPAGASAAASAQPPSPAPAQQRTDTPVSAGAVKASADTLLYVAIFSLALLSLIVIVILLRVRRKSAKERR